MYYTDSWTHFFLVSYPYYYIKYEKIISSVLRLTSLNYIFLNSNHQLPFWSLQVSRMNE